MLSADQTKNIMHFKFISVTECAYEKYFRNNNAFWGSTVEAEQEVELILEQALFRTINVLYLMLGRQNEMKDMRIT